MASQSGLSSGPSRVTSLIASTSASTTATWSDLMRRQCRIQSAAGEVEKRMNVVQRRLQALGYVPEIQASPVMTGPEWTALAHRQHTLLESICSVKDRLKSLGFATGWVEQIDEENRHKPNLVRKTPSHFNNKQLQEIITRGKKLEEQQRERQHAASSSSSSQQPHYSHQTYILTKLLVMVLVRDLTRFITSGGYRPVSELLPKEALEIQVKEEWEIATNANATAAASTIPDPSTTSTAESSSSSTSPSFSSASPLFTFLLNRIIWILCDLTLTPQETNHMLTQGAALLVLSLRIDSETRQILHDEPYEVNGDNLTPSAAFNASLASFKERQTRSWFTSGVSPFAHMHFTRPPSCLADAQRVPCSKCQRPAALYCPFCMIPTLPEEMRIPEVRLPLMVDIVHHVGENVKKSTSIHACILSPSYCRFLEFPEQLPEYDPRKTILLYPTSDAVYLDDESIDMSAIERVIVIESTWTKSDVVARHPTLSKLQRVKIRDHESTFWRYQELGRHFLSTLEAIYYTCLEFQTRKGNNVGAASATSSAPLASSAASSSSSSTPSSTTSAYSTDDLLYFYAFQHSRIHERYRANDGSAPRSWSGGEV